MIVMKFGGSSVADAERIKRVAAIVRSQKARDPVVVVSALRGVTDQLLDLARASLKGDRRLLAEVRRRHEKTADALKVPRAWLEPLFQELDHLTQGIGLLKELTPRTLDRAASFGERLSARLIAAAFAAEGLPAKAVDAPQAGLLTDERFGAATPLKQAQPLLRQSLTGMREVPVVTGFIGRTRQGEVTTLGRNGSDFSATIVGAALRAREVQIWSDTDGIMTADPRMVAGAKPLPVLSFEEACELAYYGGRVLHPHTLVPAMRRGIPVRVLNSFKPEHPGTVIRPRASGGAAVKSIAFKRKQEIVTVASPRMAAGYGFLERIFGAFARASVSVDVIATSEVTVSATTRGGEGLPAALAQLRQEFEVKRRPGAAVVCVVGDGIQARPGVAGDVFGAMKDARVNVLMISQGASKNNITFVVDDADAPKAVAALHKKFFGT